MVAVKISNKEGHFVLLAADSGYAERSWREGVVSGIALDRTAQRQSLEWIRQESLSPQCIKVLATHDADVAPHILEF